MKRQYLIFLLMTLGGCSLINTVWTPSVDELNGDIAEARRQGELYDNWRRQEEAKIEYLVGTTKQTIKSKFGKTNKKRKSRKYYYKGESGIAEEWIYTIKNNASRYRISFFFKDDRVVGLAAY